MIPPILEIFVVWHPQDADGGAVAEQFVEHFHGTAFSGLIGGAVEIYVRSAGWRDPQDAPRPVPPAAPLPYGVPNAALTAIVPVLGNGFAAAVQPGVGVWHEYAQTLVELREAAPEQVGIFPLRLSEGATDGTRLGEIFGALQRIGTTSGNVAESTAGTRCRDLAQGIAQLGNGQQRLKVFVSHTKQSSEGEGERLDELIERVRYVIANTRLGEYFDASDLQPGVDWASDIENHARTSALLAVRSDLYASREWCQREIATAKRAGMPVVILDALTVGEKRGSFLMDHVARVPSKSGADDVSDGAIVGSLNELVDECLKRELWLRQSSVTDAGASWHIAWWAPHAPEPLTLSSWLLECRARLPAEGWIRVLHPDPPLGPVELEALEGIATLSGLKNRLDVMTPRGLAARGG
jgi:hypothetical protein